MLHPHASRIGGRRVFSLIKTQSPPVTHSPATSPSPTSPAPLNTSSPSSSGLSTRSGFSDEQMTYLMKWAHIQDEVNARFRNDPPAAHVIVDSFAAVFRRYPRDAAYSRSAPHQRRAVERALDA